MNYDERYEKFRTSQQPPIRLNIAAEDFFKEDAPAEYREAYEKYLRGRVRPLAEKLIEKDDADQLEILESKGWFTASMVDSLIDAAMQKQKTAALIWLLILKEKKYGFVPRDFSL